MRRTFHTALGLMDALPRFPLQPVDGAVLCPDRGGRSGAVRARSRSRWRRARWEPIGGMWVEPDTNMPTGEVARPPAALRPALFREDVRRAATRVCWLPDCFGFSPALPQLLRQGRHRQLLHHQGQLVGDQPLPARPVLVGGARRQPRARPHLRQSDRRLQRLRAGRDARCRPGELPRARTEHDETPARRRLRRRRRRRDAGDGRSASVQLRDFPALPQARWARVDDFFAPCARRPRRTTRCRSGRARCTSSSTAATLTTQGAVKRLHRQRRARADHRRDGRRRSPRCWAAPRRRSLEPQWRVLLRNEFHDILPGLEHPRGL